MIREDWEWFKANTNSVFDKICFMFFIYKGLPMALQNHFRIINCVEISANLYQVNKMCENDLFWSANLCLRQFRSQKKCNFTAKTIGSFKVVNNEMQLNALPKVVNNEYLIKPWKIKTSVRMLPQDEAFPPSNGGYQKIDQLLRYVNYQTIDLKNSHIDFVCGRHLLKKLMMISHTKKGIGLQLMAYKRNETIYLALLRIPFNGYSGDPVPNGMDFEDFLLNG